MSSSQQSNDALSVAEASLRKALAWIKRHQADGRVSVDQAHAIALQVSQALNQHGKIALVIPPLLLSAAAEVHATMNQRLAPQWEHVTDTDTRMEKHPFFPKTKGYVAPALAPVPTTTPVSVPPPAPKVMSVPPVDSLPTKAAKPKTNKGKGKQPDRGTRRPREDDEVGDESRKKRKLVKSKPVITVSNDEDDQLTGTIVVKQSKPVVPQTPAPAKKAKQTNTKGRIGRPMPKGKGKGKGKEKEKDEDVVEMAVEIPAGNVFNPPCKKCDGGPCLIALGRRGQPMKSCVRCNAMKVKCERPEELLAPTEPVRSSRPWSKAAPTLKSGLRSRSTRATSRVRQPTPIVESEDAGDDTVVPTAKDDIVMSDAAKTDQQTDVAAPCHTSDHPATITLVNDFPPDHWLEESDPITIPPPPPTAEPTTSAESLPWKWPTCATHTRINAVEQDCDSQHHLYAGRVCRCPAQLQPDGGGGYRSLLPGGEIKAGLLNVQPILPTANAWLSQVVQPPQQWVGQTSASRLGRPNVQGSTFTSGQPSSESVQAGPSSAPAVQGDLGVVSTDSSPDSSPASVTNSLP
ncbi:hypothetical protein EDD22DRAFT_956203 [Suillus occidentalis]|nr:hypothetical protein EDD22DRAFT_956203 [Suillus occidentalis]